MIIKDRKGNSYLLDATFLQELVDGNKVDRVVLIHQIGIALKHGKKIDCLYPRAASFFPGAKIANNTTLDLFRVSKTKTSLWIGCKEFTEDAKAIIQAAKAAVKEWK